MSLTVVGVRHHSPACARLVRSVIAELRPRFVLIEGPADFNPRIGELLLGHRPPVAIFTFYQHDAQALSSWTPFCDYSPEWVALAEGAAIGATVRFMDLPAWSKAFDGIKNRYADHDRARLDYVGALCKKLGIDGMDALWDHLFEQPLDPVDLRARLGQYFEALRAEEAAGGRDDAREAYMARAVRWALAESRREGGEVVAVCGGYHKPALERLAEDATGDEGWPEHPQPAPGARFGSYLVPYSFHRLDSFVGYQSGMPSPGYYQAVWELGPERASDAMLAAATARLRDKRQPVSAADLIAASGMAEGLARVRGHASLARTDLLDGIAAALVKQALEAPLPWSVRGTLRMGTDPLIVEVVAALSGDRRGTLAEGTPAPALLADIAGQLASHDLLLGQPDRPEEPREVALDLTRPRERSQSRILHRLRVLAIPLVERRSGPLWATDPLLAERWALARNIETDAAMIEAAAWGGTLASAAGARLEDALASAAGDLEAICRILGEAVFVGLDALADTALAAAAKAAARETSLARLGPAMAQLLGMWRHDTLLGAAGSATIGGVLEATHDRGLWLLEGIAGATAPFGDREVVGVAAMRDVLKLAAERLEVQRERSLGVVRRRALDASAPPGLRGAALGALWSLGALDEDGEAHASAALRASALPTTVGDFLLGLFALARERISTTGPLIAAVDDIVCSMGWHEFMVAIPSLRLAWGFFPPREKDRVARAVLALHGADPEASASLVAPDASAEELMRGAEIDRRVNEIARRYGLDAEEAPE